MRIVPIICITFFSISLAAHPDTTKVLSIEQYLDWVRQYHPMAKQANLLSAQADAALMEAKGSFDPKLYTDYKNKSFDGKNYYQVGEGGVKIPTWLGIDVKAAYNWTNGLFVNPENGLPAAGQAIAGVKVPLLQGLQFDNRRAQVQQAGLLNQINEAEQQQMMNDLLLAATEAYWNWTYTAEAVKVFENAVRLAIQKFNITKESFLQGDKPAIDTLEAATQIQDRQIGLADALVEFNNATLFLSNFLWDEDDNPLKVASDVLPAGLDQDYVIDPTFSIAIFLNSPARIPALQSIRLKQNTLDIKERLKREMLKPKLDVEYNFLADGFDFINPPEEEDNQFNALVTENYKWGINFSFPLLLRKERASLDLVRIEQMQTQFKYNNKRLDIQNKVNALQQQLETTLNQIELSEAAVGNYQSLLEAENLKFRIGESSIFLLNSREQKLIDAQLKLLKLRSTYLKLEAKVQAAVGQLK